QRLVWSGQAGRFCFRSFVKDQRRVGTGCALVHARLIPAEEQAMEFITPEFFDLLIIVVIIIGLIAAFFRLRADLTRPLPPEPPDPWQPFDPDADTQPNQKSDEV